MCARVCAVRCLACCPHFDCSSIEILDLDQRGLSCRRLRVSRACTILTVLLQGQSIAGVGPMRHGGDPSRHSLLEHPIVLSAQYLTASVLCLCQHGYLAYRAGGAVAVYSCRLPSHVHELCTAAHHQCWGEHKATQLVLARRCSLPRRTDECFWAMRACGPSVYSVHGPTPGDKPPCGEGANE